MSLDLDLRDRYVLSLDPGLAAMGVAVFLLPDRLVELQVIRTEKCDKRQPVRASDDLTRRCREVWGRLTAVTDRYRPDAICLEAVSFSPTMMAAATKTAMARGMLVALAERLGGLPIVEASPQDVKKAVCGRRDASKQEVEEAVMARWPESRQLGSRLRKTDREHAYDSCAVFAACQEADVIRLLRNS